MDSKGVLLESKLFVGMPQASTVLVTNKVTCALPYQIQTILSCYLLISKILVLPGGSSPPTISEVLCVLDSNRPPYGLIAGEL